MNRVFELTDYEEFLAEPLHVCLEEEGSYAFFAWRGPNTYELHVEMKVKGRQAIEMLRRMLAWMVNEYNASGFWALIPCEKRNVRLFARWMGWKSRGLLTTRTGPCELFTSEN